MVQFGSDDRNVDELADRFELDWQNETQPRIEEYLQQLPANSQEQALTELLKVEIEFRTKQGEAPTAEEYRARFPQWGELVEQVFHQIEEREAITAPVAMVTSSQSIGPYRLLSKLGEGGMGQVWMASQKQPIVRRVALKLIRSGLDSQEVIARFEAERQALAMMDHPHIAKVLDVGQTEQGQPYFVMELIQGVPFNQYCDTHRLSLRERLELFLPVCQAVQHAHQKGIIHRDLKPSNVLVTEVDGKPTPKVIDFGMAKALSHQTRLTDKTLFTDFGQILGTVQYMSPEQAENAGMDIDTRTDIYSLGVMLYESLTGSPPIDRETIREHAIREILRLIAEVDPPRPSKKLSDLGDSTAGVASDSRTKRSRLLNTLRGELDWIVMKAIEKDRGRRYPTASAMADDLRRYLADEPVEARPPSALYRWQKAVRKHRLAVATLTGMFLLLVAGIVSTTLQAHRAQTAEAAAMAETERAEAALATAQQERQAAVAAKEEADSQRKQAETVSDYMVATFQSPDPKRDGSGVTVAETLNRAEAQLDKTFAQEPLIKARLLTVIGQSRLGLGLPQEASKAFAKAAAIYLQAYGEQHEDTLRSQADMALAQIEAGELDQAIEQLKTVMPRYETLLGKQHPDVLSVKGNLGLAYEKQGNSQQAIAIHEEVLADTLLSLGKQHRDTHVSQVNLGLSYLNAGEFDKAIAIFEQCYDEVKDNWDANNPDLYYLLNNLAGAYYESGNIDKAIPLLEETVRLRKQQLTVAHPMTLDSMKSLIAVYLAAGRTQEAMDVAYERLVNMPYEPLDLLDDYHHCFFIAHRLNDELMATKLADLLLAATTKAYPTRPNKETLILSLIAHHLSRGEEWSLAERLGTRAVEVAEQSLAPTHPIRSRAERILSDIKSHNRKGGLGGMSMNVFGKYLSPSIKELKQRAGEECTVTFRVIGSGGEREINLYSAYNPLDPNTFTVIIAEKAIDDVTELGIADFWKDIAGKKVEVTGTLIAREDTIGMVFTEGLTGKLRVLDETKSQPEQEETDPPQDSPSDESN